MSGGRLIHKLRSGGLAGRLGLGLVARGVSAVATLVMQAILARSLTTEDLADYFVLMGIAHTAAAFFGFGLSDCSSRFRTGAKPNAGSFPEDAGRVAGAMAAAAGGAALFALAAPLAFSPLIGVTTALLLGFWSASLMLSFVLSAWLMAAGAARLATIGYFGLSTTAGFVFIAIAASAGVELTLHLAMGLVGLGWFSSVALMAPKWLRDIARAAPTLRLPDVKSLLTTGAPIMGANLATLLAAWTPVWLLAWLSTDADTAIFGVARSLVSGVTLILIVAHFMMRPIAVSLSQQDKIAEMTDLARTTATVAAAPLAVFVLATAAFGGLLLSAIYGPGFEAGHWVLPGFGLAVFMQAVLGPGETMLRILGHERATLRAHVTIVLALLAPQAAAIHFFGVWGAVGAAIAQLTALHGVFAHLAATRLGVGTIATLSFRQFRRGLSGI